MRRDGVVTRAFLVPKPLDEHGTFGASVCTVHWSDGPPGCTRVVGTTLKCWSDMTSSRPSLVMHDVLWYCRLEGAGCIGMWRIANDRQLALGSYDSGVWAPSNWTESEDVVYSVVDVVAGTVRDVPLNARFGRGADEASWHYCPRSGLLLGGEWAVNELGGDVLCVRAFDAMTGEACGENKYITELIKGTSEWAREDGWSMPSETPMATIDLRAQGKQLSVFTISMDDNAVVEWWPLQSEWRNRVVIRVPGAEQFTRDIVPTYGDDEQLFVVSTTCLLCVQFVGLRRMPCVLFVIDMSARFPELRSAFNDLKDPNMFVDVYAGVTPFISDSRCVVHVESINRVYVLDYSKGIPSTAMLSRLVNRTLEPWEHLIDVDEPFHPSTLFEIDDDHVFPEFVDLEMTGRCEALSFSGFLDTKAVPVVQRISTVRVTETTPGLGDSRLNANLEHQQFALSLDRRSMAAIVEPEAGHVKWVYVFDLLGDASPTAERAMEQTWSVCPEVDGLAQVVRKWVLGRVFVDSIHLMGTFVIVCMNTGTPTAEVVVFDLASPPA